MRRAAGCHREPDRSAGGLLRGLGFCPAVIRVAGFWLLLTSIMLIQPVSAQRTGETPRQLEGTGMEEQLGESIPIDLVFRNEAGEEVQLARYFNGEKPVLLALIYHDCPMLCSLVLHGLTEGLGGMEWVPGNEFEVVAVSFNPRETPELARSEKEMYLKMLGNPDAGAGIHFLTGTEPSIAALTSAVGFKYKWVEEENAYAHPSGLIFLNGDGKIARYLYGVEYEPRVLRTALVEASSGKVGSPIDQIILYCFQFDPGANSYVLQARNLMKLGGGLTILLLGSALFMYWRRESRRSNHLAAASGAEMQ